MLIFAAERESIAHTMQSVLDEATDPWGVKVERVEMYKFVCSLYFPNSSFQNLQKRCEVTNTPSESHGH